MLLAAPQLLAGDPACTADQLVCAGDPVFTYQNGTLTYGTVQGVDAGDKIRFSPKGAKTGAPPVTFDREYVATTRAKGCYSSGTENFCPGQGTQRASSTKGLVLAVFPTGYLVVSESGQKPQSLKFSELKKRETAKQDSADFKNILQQFSYLTKLVQLPAPQACPDCLQKNAANASLPSFRNILLNPRKNAQLIKGLGKSCSNFLKALYRSGKTLKSEGLQNRSRPLKAYIDSAETSFYHWTNSRAFANSMARNKSVEHLKEFEFLRATARSGYPFLPEQGMLFVARKPTSSSSYGSIQIRFEMDPDARVIDRAEVHLPQVLTELDQQHPGFLTACKTVHVSTGAPGLPDQAAGLNDDTNEAVFFILEDSGIDLLDYEKGLPMYHDWFMVIGPKAIRGSSVKWPGKSPAVGHVPRP